MHFFQTFIFKINFCWPTMFLMWLSFTSASPSKSSGWRKENNPETWWLACITLDLQCPITVRFECKVMLYEVAQWQNTVQWTECEEEKGRAELSPTLCCYAKENRIVCEYKWYKVKFEWVLDVRQLWAFL